MGFGYRKKLEVLMLGIRYNRLRRSFRGNAITLMAITNGI